MPKALFVDPDVLHSPSKLTFPEIPIHAYRTPLSEERLARGDAALVSALRHMMVVREFESMLAVLKATGAYSGVAHNYKGPAHLSIGQEGAAVGAALALEPCDHIFGSHRSHGEFIAKGLSAIDKLPRAELMGVMENYRGGALLSTVERHIGGETETASGRGLSAFRPAGGNLHARQRLQRRHGRLDARLFHALRRLSQQRHRRRLRRNRDRRRARQETPPQRRRRRRQHWRRVDRLRPGLGGDEFRGHGAVPDAVGRSDGRPADALLLQQQFLRHGRPDHRRDHGLGPSVPHRRGGQRGGDARRDGRRDQSARRRRRRPTEAGTACRRQRPGAPRRRVLSEHGAFDYGRQRLPFERRDRALVRL